MIVDLDTDKKLIRPKLMLAKPNKEIISPIPEFYNGKQNIKLGKVNELSFDIPIEIDHKHEKIHNKNVELIKEKFLIEFKKGLYTEWYIVDKINRHMDEDKEYMSYQCFSLPYELSRKHIKDYSVISKTATEVLTAALDETIWSIDIMSATFDLKYRAFDVTTKSVLDFVFEIAEKYNALIIWDTVNRQISFYDLDAIGSNKGLKVKYGKLLNNIRYEENTDEIATRLKIFGRSGISINKLQPTGVNYLENYNHYLYPFERDASKNVLKSSDYFSDSLSNALLDYQELVESKQGEFDTLLSQLTTLESTLTNKQNELFILETELAVIEDDLSTANANGDPTATLITNKTNKQAEIDTKKAEITTVESDIAAKQTEINTLKNLIAIENNFTVAQLEEWNPFIIVKEWSNDNYTDEEELYEAGLEEFEKIRSPKIIAEIGIVNILELIEEQKNWDKLNIGDTVVIEHEKLGIDVSAKMMEFNFDYESGDVSVVIANVKEIISDKEKFMQEHYNSVSTSTVFSQSKIKYDDAKATTDAVSQIINGTWDAVDRKIKASNDESVEISRKGIIIKDPNDPLKYVVMQHGQIALTGDGGNSWKTAVMPDGVIAERLIGQIILGNQLNISDDDGMFTIVGNLLTVKDPTDVVRVMLGEYATGKYGLKLMNKSGTATVLDEDGMLQTWQESAADNLDSSNPLTLNVYIPNNTISVREVKLRFKLLPFRSYSSTSSSGGGSTETTASASIDLTSTGAQNYTLGGGWLPGDWMDFAGSHSHSVSGTVSINSAGSHSHAIWDTDTWMDGTVRSASDNTTTNGDHTHTGSISVSMDSAGGHAHGRDTAHNHSITVPSHSHTVSIPSHSHSLVHGIFTSTNPLDVTVTINGVSRTTVLGGSFNADQSNLDITSYMVIGQWNTISLGTSRLGRLDSNIFIQTFMGV